jgi:hypothetical protein
MSYAVFDDGAISGVDKCDSELSTERHGEEIRL